MFWGLLLIWFGVIAAAFHPANIFDTFRDSWFALGTGGLLVLMNAVRASMRLKVSALTLGLGVLIGVIYVPIVFFSSQVPFVPVLLVILGAALIIGALRSQKLC
jgi:hypothetical protein